MTGALDALDAEEKTAHGPEVEAVLALIRSRGGRLTTARRLLIEALFSAAHHHTAEELAAHVQEQAPDIHLSTVYRNLEELERLDVVSHVHLGHGPAVYHPATDSHRHLVCQGCGAVTEAPREAFESLVEELQARFGFAVDTRHFAAQGLCAGCAKRTGAG
jgi:Fur family ferric uptake transcriptional regulator